MSPVRWDIPHLHKMQILLKLAENVAKTCSFPQYCLLLVIEHLSILIMSYNCKCNIKTKTLIYLHFYRATSLFLFPVCMDASEAEEHKNLNVLKSFVPQNYKLNCVFVCEQDVQHSFKDKYLKQCGRGLKCVHLTHVITLIKVSLKVIDTCSSPTYHYRATSIYTSTILM